MVPSTYKGLVNLFIKIADNGGTCKPSDKIDEEDVEAVCECVANIQNWLGENRDTLEKLGLEYNG